MSAYSYQYVFTPPNITVAEGYSTVGTDGTARIVIPAGGSRTVIARTSMIRSDTASKGYQLDAVLVNYKVDSGTLASVTASVNRVDYVDDTAPASSAYTLGAANPAYDLVATDGCRARQAITGGAPMGDWEDDTLGAIGAAGLTAVFQVAYTFTAVAGGAVTVNLFNIEMEVTGDFG